MKRKVKVVVEMEKRGFSDKKKVHQEHAIEVDGKTYKKMQMEKKNRPYSIETKINASTDINADWQRFVWKSREVDIQALITEE